MAFLPISPDLRSALWWPLQARARDPAHGFLWRVLLNARPGRSVTLHPLQIRELHRTAMETLFYDPPPAPEAAALRRLMRWCEKAAQM